MEKEQSTSLADYFFGIAHGVMIGSVLALGVAETQIGVICNQHEESISQRQTIASLSDQESLAFNHPTSLSPKPPRIQ